MIYIHIGSWKTGTTLIQKILRKHRDKFRNKGVYFADQNSESFQTLFIPAFRKYILDPGTRKLKAAVDSLYSLFDRENCNHILFSWEGFLGHPFLARKDGMYHPNETSMLLGEVSQIQPIQVIFYFRNQADLIESMYAQDVRHARFLGGFDHYFDNVVPKNISWLEIVEILVNQLGESNVDVKPFESIKLGTTHFLDAFFSKIINVDFVYNIDHANPSFSHKAIELAKVCYPLLSDEEIILMRKFLAKNFSTLTHDKCDYLGPTRRAEINARYKQENITLIKRFTAEYDPQLLGY